MANVLIILCVLVPLCVVAALTRVDALSKNKDARPEELTESTVCISHI